MTVHATTFVAPLTRRGPVVPGRGHEYNSHLAAGAGDARVLLFDRREACFLSRRRFCHRGCGWQTLRAAACVVLWGTRNDGQQRRTPGAATSMCPLLLRRNGSSLRAGSRRACSPKLGLSNKAANPDTEKKPQVSIHGQTYFRPLALAAFPPSHSHLGSGSAVVAAATTKLGPRL